MMKHFRLLLLALVLLIPAASAEEAGNPFVAIEIEDYGTIIAELRPDIAPRTVGNFLTLTDSGFYDGLTFHRIISGFMIQGGDPNGNGTGGSAETIPGEFAANGFQNDLSHVRGVLSMARSSNMNGASSQFFIMHADGTHLDGSYAAFGKVVAGMSVVDHICMNAQVTDTNGTVGRSNQPVITSVRRITAEEAAEAVRAEAENGREGTVFQDPFSGLTFQVPVGFNLDLSTAENGFFAFRSAEDATLLYEMIVDYWGRQNASMKAVFIENGYTREAITTDAFEKADFAKAAQVTEDQLSWTEFNDCALYVTNQEGRTAALGAINGCILVFEEYGCPEALNELLSTLHKDSPN